MANTSKIRKGNDLMVFIKGEGENATMKSVAFATSHQFSMSLETETVQTKDSGYDGAELAKNITWEITSDNLYIDGEYETLQDMMLKKKVVDLVWGVAKGTNTTPEKGLGLEDPETADNTKFWTNDTSVKYNSGKALITSLQVSASAGENATYSVTFKGSGSITPSAAAASA